MQEGAVIKGRIVRDGKGLKDVVVGLATIERTCGSCLQDFEAVTGQNGWFLLLNVTPQRDYHLFAKMDSLADRGALPARKVSVGATGTTADLGELKLVPARRITGRVALSDGKPIPPDTRLHLSREMAWDHTEVTLDANGAFQVIGVPEEPISINVRVKGYKFSKRNPSLDRLNGSILGRVDGDLKDLTLLMEPDEGRPNREPEDLHLFEGPDSQPGNKPLRGARL
jgi:hypothetical protein